MEKEGADKLPAQIEYHIVVAVLGPIISGNYTIGQTRIQVSYPPFVNLAPHGPVSLPNGLSTMFRVMWEDSTGKSVAKIRAKGSERFEPLYYALEQINEILLAYKLVRIGHINGSEVRTIGEADCLLHAPFINGRHTGDLNVSLRTHGGTNRWGFANPKHPEDPLGTTELALPHIGQATFPMHGGYHANRRSAAFALFASMKLLLVLSRNGALKLDLPDGMYREARILAAWQDSPPKWIPRNDQVEHIND